MMKQTNNILGLAIAVSLVSALPLNASASLDDLSSAVSSGKAYGDLRLRYENVAQDNSADDANALTLRTRLGYTTGAYEGFSAGLEFEDSRVVAGENAYELPGPARPAGYTVKGKSVVADPETTELDQGFLQYQGENYKVKLGRQVLTMDNHRYVGHVGWRQDRQSFDGASLQWSPTEEFSAHYAYLGQRNRIFAEQADIDSKDHLLNLGFETGIGKLSAYAYLLEVDSANHNALDTFGLRFSGGTSSDDIKYLYTAEYASQRAEAGSSGYDADYFMLEAGAVLKGVTAKLGYEVLGSDDGGYGFSTPLATLHKFNGWTDQFLNTPTQGLRDIYLSVSGKLAGGSWLVAYHDFAADDSATSGVDDLGSEIELLYKRKFHKHYNAGIKYAMYSAGDAAANKVDTDKLWVWVGASF